MTDEISDAMTLRRHRAMNIRVRDCALDTDVEPYTSRQTAMTQFALALKEMSSRMLHCASCLIQHPVPAKRLEFSFMFATFDDDPLQNFWKYANLTCANCGAEEVLALDKPTRRAASSPALAGPYDNTKASSWNPNDPWERAYQEIEEEEKRRFTVNAQNSLHAQQSQMAARQAHLAQQYGNSQYNMGQALGASADALRAELDAHTRSMFGSMSIRSGPAPVITTDYGKLIADLAPEELAHIKKQGLFSKLIGPKK